MKYTHAPVFILINLISISILKASAEQELNDLLKETTFKANDNVDKKTEPSGDVKYSTENDIYISIGIRTKANAKIHTKIVYDKDGNINKNEVDKASEIGSEANDNAQTKMSNKNVKDLGNTKDNVIDISIGMSRSSKENPNGYTNIVYDEQTKEFPKTKTSGKEKAIETIPKPKVVDVIPNETVKENMENDTSIQTTKEKSNESPKTKENAIDKVVQITPKPNVETTSQATIDITPKPTVEATSQATVEGIPTANVETTSTTIKQYFDETPFYDESEDEEDKKLDDEIDKLNITVEKFSNMDDEVTDPMTIGNYDEVFMTEPNWLNNSTSSTEEPINWWENDRVNDDGWGF
uniref:Uncharacterized protein n=1 Tax=Cacopsylla melanoneura TaxID=428564 RepID=A0A8D8YGW0_9HEMI